MREASETLDVLVIGAGWAGLGCSAALKSQNVKFLLVEKGKYCGSFWEVYAACAVFTIASFSLTCLLHRVVMNGFLCTLHIIVFLMMEKESFSILFLRRKGKLLNTSRDTETCMISQ